MSPPVETVLVTGFLGAGKTTLLSGWLAERPARERWAVLVNEFGALGVDRALLGGDGASDDAVAIAEIAGGCACCAARVGFDATLTRLLRRGPWDRLLVETTGLGHPAPLADRLRPETIEDVVGQDHLLGPDGPIGRMLAQGRLASLILWGPPGVGKTTIARLMA
nr:GTP-binding protein [Burkholderiaceae bacterium]